MMLLGDAVAAALECVGITPERLEEWLGAPCGCEERKEKLNEAHRWALRVLGGKRDDHHKRFEEMIEPPPDWAERPCPPGSFRTENGDCVEHPIE